MLGGPVHHHRRHRPIYPWDVKVTVYFKCIGNIVANCAVPVKFHQI